MKYLVSILFISATMLMVGCTTTQPVDDSSTDLNQTDNVGVTNIVAETDVNGTNTSIENVNNVGETDIADDIDTTDETAENTNEEIAPDVDTSDWLTYTNEYLGLTFEYPNKWGLIVQNIEKGCLDEDDISSGPCEHVSLELPSLGDATIFLATQTVRFANNPPGRGAYWGDESGKIKDDSYLENYCNDTNLISCEVYRNKNNILITRSIEELPMNIGTVVLYQIKSSDSMFNGIVFSTDRLRDKGIEQLEDTMDTVIDSLSFINS